MIPRLMAVALTSIAIPACIFGEPARFEAPREYPPSIESAATASNPINRVVVWVPTAAGDDAGGRDLTFEVEIRDPNVDQVLQYKVYVDYDAATPPEPILFDDVPRVTSGDRTRRPLSFTVPPGLVQDEGCHRVEMLVSGNFRRVGREPLNAGDIGTATWWIATTSGDVVDMRGCPR